MSMSDLMSNLKLSSYPEIALPIFLLLFVGACVYAFTRSRREIEHAARLPIDDQPSSVNSNQERLS